MRIYFPDSDDTVIVEPAPNGRYIACLADQDGEGPIVWGLGDSVLSAIADLNNSLNGAD